MASSTQMTLTLFFINRLLSHDFCNKRHPRHNHVTETTANKSPDKPYPIYSPDRCTKNPKGSIVVFSYSWPVVNATGLDVVWCRDHPDELETVEIDGVAVLDSHWIGVSRRRVHAFSNKATPQSGMHPQVKFSRMKLILINKIIMYFQWHCLLFYYRWRNMFYIDGSNLNDNKKTPHIRVMAIMQLAVHFGQMKAIRCICSKCFQMRNIEYML